jgi:hypothetical protein
MVALHGILVSVAKHTRWGLPPSYIRKVKLRTVPGRMPSRESGVGGNGA